MLRNPAEGAEAFEDSHDYCNKMQYWEEVLGAASLAIMEGQECHEKKYKISSPCVNLNKMF